MDTLYSLWTLCFLVSLTLLGRLASDSFQCPLGWYGRGGSSSCYKLFLEKRDWFSAKEACEGQGGYLLIINTKPEVEWVAVRLSEQFDHVTGNKPRFWIGLISEYNGWKWIDDSPLDTSIVEWENGIPEVEPGKTCVIFTEKGTLDLLACGQNRYFICERNVGTPPICDSENGWEYIAGSCYKVTSSPHEEWTRARQLCKDFNSDLIVINTAEEQEYAKNTAIRLQNDVWIGITEIGTPGIFHWVDFTPLNETANYWDTNGIQPLPMNGQACGRINNDNKAGNWSTAFETDELAYICEKTTGTCVNGMEEFEQSCYLLSEKQYDWFTSKKQCADIGTQLAIIENAAEDEFLVALTDHTPNTWIGLVETKANSDEWAWVDGRTLNDTGFTSWYSTFDDLLPNGHNSTDRTCGYIQKDGKTYPDMRWDVAHCDKIYYHICEIPRGQSVNIADVVLKPESCPDDWLNFAGYCYMFSDEEASWSQARSLCQEEDSADLASILSIMERNFIKDHLKSASWIGFNDRKNENKWEWSDGSYVSLLNWAKGEPNDKGGKENCAGIMPQREFKWNDMPCEVQLDFICKKKAFVDGRPIVTPTTITQTWSENCGSGWTENPLTGICYRYVSQMMIWEDARQECIHVYGKVGDGGRNANLLSVNTLEEQLFLTGWLATLPLHTSVWMGCSDRSREGGWEWTNGSPFAFLNWADGEPNSGGKYHKDEDCGELLPNSNGEWNDKMCNSRIPFICEKMGTAYIPPPSPTPPGMPCPASWISSFGNCYFFSNVKAANHDDAEARCKDAHSAAHLTSILDQAEQDFIKSNIYGWSYIGLNDRAVEKTFVWSNGAPFGYSNWGDKEPNNYGDEDCVEMRSTGKWNDLPCKATRRYVCKITMRVCPHGWELHNGQCYYISDYRADWEHARQKCQEVGYGADLASLQSPEENYYLTDKAHKDIWIGYNDIDVQGTWTWSDGSKNLYENWNIGEPNYLSKERCTLILYDVKKWNNDPCDRQKYFACKLTPSHKVGCDSGWVSNGRHCYQLNYNDRNWMKAQDDCRRQNSELMSVYSEAEQEFLLSLMEGGYDLQRASCPPGWILWKANCYYFSTLKEKTNWNTATGKCKDMNSASTLASIHSQDENTFIANSAPANTWIGLNSIKTKGQWIWSDKSNTDDYDGNWNNNEPNNLKTERCTEIIHREGQTTHGKWDNLKCKLLRNYVCKFPAGQFLYRAWIGLSDRSKVQSFQWSDSSPMTYTNWGHGMPSKHAGEGSACVYADRKNGAWYHTSCEDGAGYICKTSQTVVEITETDNGCQQGQVAYGPSCYETQVVPLTWEEANGRCENKGGSLIAVRNRYEQSLLSSIISDRQKTFWIGLTDSASPGTFTWSSGEMATYTNWHTGEPDTKNGHCVAATSTGLIGMWFVSCCKETFTGICEYKRVGWTPEPTTPPTTLDPSFQCRTGWYDYNNKCYKDLGWNSGEECTWDEARAFCMNMGGDLVSFVDSNEEKRILKNLYLMYGTAAHWIGLRENVLAETGYEWSDGTPAVYFNWEAGEPDSHNGREKCVGIDGWQRKWSDFNCGTKKSYICETKKGLNIASLLPLPTSIPDVPCTEGDKEWLLYNGNCYNFNSKIDSSAGQSWQQALIKCQEKGGALASVHTFEESNYMLRKITDFRDFQMWIGMTALGLDAGHFWVDGTVFNFVNWAKGEPNDALQQESCVTMYTTDGYWNDANCGMTLGFICKKPQYPSTGTTASTIPAPKGNCPSEWHQFENKCYRIFGDNEDELVNWDTARKNCMDLGSMHDLVSIHEELEQAFLTSLLVSHPFRVWVGMHDRLGENTFFWSDESTVDFVNWGRNEPNGESYYMSEDCVEMMNEVVVAGHWNDVSCMQEDRGYMCMRKTDPTITTPPARTMCTDEYFDYEMFGGDCYKLFTEEKSWQDAESRCAKDGGAHLVSIVDLFHQSFLRNFVRQDSGDSVWIGMKASSDAKSWAWSDGWPVLYTNWGRNQPGTSHQTCVWYAVGDGQWYVDDCSKQMSFVCKYSQKPIPTPQLFVDGQCPDNTWNDLGTASCYKFEGESIISWSDANTKCFQMGGSLASIHSTYEMMFISQIVAQYKNNMWIGLVRNLEGTFAWFNRAPFDYENWSEDEPSSKTEQCTEIYHHTGYWNDIACSARRGYICMTAKIANTKVTMRPTHTVEIPSSSVSAPSVIVPGGTTSTAATKKTTTKASTRVTDTTSKPSTNFPYHTTFILPSVETYRSPISGGGVAGIVITCIVILLVVAVILIYLNKSGILNKKSKLVQQRGSPMTFENALYSAESEQVNISTTDTKSQHTTYASLEPGA